MLPRRKSVVCRGDRQRRTGRKTDEQRSLLYTFIFQCPFPNVTSERNCFGQFLVGSEERTEREPVLPHNMHGRHRTPHNLILRQAKSQCVENGA